MTDWPDTLPQCPILNGFSEQRQRNVVSFKPDVGPPKIRRRASASAVNASVSFRMTVSELEDFNTFFVDTLEDGSLPFDWVHPLDGLEYEWWFDPNEAPRLERITPNTFRIAFDLLRFGAGVHEPETLQIGARFAGNGRLSTNAVMLPKAVISWAEFELRDPVHHGSVRFAGSGNVSATMQQTQRVQAQFAGAGNLRARYTGPYPASARFAGSGNLTILLMEAFQEDAFQEDAFS